MTAVFVDGAGFVRRLPPSWSMGSVRFAFTDVYGDAEMFYYHQDAVAVARRISHERGAVVHLLRQLRYVAGTEMYEYVVLFEGSGFLSTRYGFVPDVASADLFRVRRLSSVNASAARAVKAQHAGCGSKLDKTAILCPERTYAGRRDVE